MGALLNQLEGEIGSYVNDSVVIHFLTPVTASGRLFRGERFEFRVAVENRGPLEMRSTVVQVSSTPAVLIGRAETPDSALEGTVTSAPFIVPARDPSFGPWTYTVPGVLKGIARLPTDVTDIVRAQILSWDASLTHLLYIWSMYGDPVSLRASVRPLFVPPPLPPLQPFP
jgi:hypothetical protein